MTKTTEGKGIKEIVINWLIKFSKANTNKISDGYHTFGELYEHRIELWMTVCRNTEYSWKTKTHSDGSIWNGWFLLGIGYDKGSQVTYHLPIKYWARLRKVQTLAKAPDFDGHTPKDVINRLHNL